MAKIIKSIIKDEEKKELVMQFLVPASSIADEEFSAEDGLQQEETISNDAMGEDNKNNEFHEVPKQFLGYEVIAEERVCDLLSVKAVIKKIPQENSTPEVEFLKVNRFGSETFKIPLSTLGDTKKFCEALANHHILLKQSNQFPVVDYLRADVDHAQQNEMFHFEHTPLGFYEYNGKLHFFWEKTLIDDKHYSKCVREFGKFKMGNEEEYDEMLRKYVFPDTHLSLAYALGFSSVLAARLYDYTDIGVPLISFNGKSSTGKSLSCMLAISSFANPNLQSGSLMIKTDSSANGLTSQLSNSEGLIFCMDDIDTDSSRIMSDTIYRLSNGTGRTVSSVKGEAIQRGSWKGTILINSETSPGENIHKGGIGARLIEFKDVLWTKSAEIADNIRNIITKSYGHKGEKFGKHIAELNIEQILTDFNYCKDEVANQIKNRDSLSSRIINKYALILLTIKYVNSFFNICLNEKEILDFVLKNEEKNVLDRNKPLASYTYLFEYYLENSNNFNVKAGKKLLRTAKNKCFGEAIYTSDTIQLCIRSNQLRDIMFKGGFTQYKSYRDDWKKRGYILHDDGRCDTSNKILGRHYKFLYEKSNIDYTGE